MDIIENLSSSDELFFLKEIFELIDETTPVAPVALTSVTQVASVDKIKKIREKLYNHVLLRKICKETNIENVRSLLTGIEPESDFFLMVNSKGETLAKHFVTGSYGIEFVKLALQNSKIDRKELASAAFKSYAPNEEVCRYLFTPDCITRSNLHNAIYHKFTDDFIKLFAENDKAFAESADLELSLQRGYSNDIIKLFIEKGCEIGTCIHSAIKYGYDTEIIKMLASKADLCLKNKDGRTPINMSLLYNRDIEVVKLLSRDKSVFSISDNYGFIPLHTAVNYSKSEEVVEYVASFGHLDTQDNQGCVAAHYAITRDESDYITGILTTPKNILLKNYNDDTLLNFAIEHNKSYDVIKSLVHKDILDNVNYKGKTSLHIAVDQESSPEIVELLITKDNVNILNDNYETILYEVVEKNIYGYETIKLFVNDYNLNEKNLAGETPVYNAIYSKKSYDIVKLLCTDKNVIEKNRGGDTPLDTSIIFGNSETTKAILSMENAKWNLPLYSIIDYDKENMLKDILELLI